MRKLLIILAALMLISTPSFAQTKKELEAKKKKVTEELATTTKMLNQTQKDKKGTENKISILGESIKKSAEYINTLSGEIDMLQHNIDSLENTKLSHEERLRQLKNQYALACRAQYKHHKYFSTTSYIFSASSLNQAYRRFLTLKQINSKRRELAQQILEITELLTLEQNTLNENLSQKENAKSQKNLETQRLQQQRIEQEKHLKSLKKKETQLKEKQKKQQAQANQLNKKIQEIIAKEIEKQNKKSTSTTTKTSPPKFEMSKEEKLVAGNFEANKGKLPRPIEKGFISGHFGVHPHPVLDKVTVNNKGVYFQTPISSEARAVFDGEVTSCFSVNGTNTSIIIKHGNYRSVYSNLKKVYVKPGDKVTARQKIGQIYTDEENDNKTELFFALYKETELLNPENWLAK